MNSLWIALAVSFVVLNAAVTASLYDVSANKQLEKYKYRNKLLHDLLLAENCPEPSEKPREKRELAGGDEADERTQTQLEVEMKFYEDLTTMLIECRKGNTATSPSEETSTAGKSTKPPKKLMTTLPTKPSTMPTSPSAKTDKATETRLSNPAACQQAIHLTEYWRQDYNGSNIEVIDGEFPVCDTKEMEKAGRPWFRFSGDAGDRLLDFCVPYDSCGTNFPLWSDDTMPSAIGLETRFQVYSSVAGECRHETFNATVIRCSDSVSDFVYRWELNVKDKFHCFYGFCGMSTR